jgi:hypothetical protein
MIWNAFSRRYISHLALSNLGRRWTRRWILIAHSDPFSISFNQQCHSTNTPIALRCATVMAVTVRHEVTMGAAVRRAAVCFSQITAIALLGVGAAAALAWTGFLAYLMVALIERLA